MAPKGTESLRGYFQLADGVRVVSPHVQLVEAWSWSQSKALSFPGCQMQKWITFKQIISSAVRDFCVGTSTAVQSHTATVVITATTVQSEFKGGTSDSSCLFLSAASKEKYFLCLTQTLVRHQAIRIQQTYEWQMCGGTKQAGKKRRKKKDEWVHF